MRQGKFLFVILSLVGVNNVFGQNWYPGSTYTNINPSTTNVGIGVAVSPAVAPIAKLQVIGTTTLPAAIFSTGNVGIGSFTTAASVTDLLHVKDGNAFFQNSTLRISKQGGEALLVSAGISRLTGGIYVGSQQVGGGASMEYGLDGIFKIQSRSNTVNYDFLIDGNMTFTSNSGYNGKINAQQLNLYNSIGDGYDYGAIRMGKNNTNYWHIGQATGDNSFRIMRYNGTNWVSPLILDYTYGNVGIGTSPSVSHKLEVNGSISNGGADFVLGKLDGRSIGTKTAQRALVHDLGDVLWVNYDGDFEGGVKMGGRGLAVKEVCVNTSIAWCDYVFEPNYRLMPLNQLQSFIQKNKHLPEIPTSAEVEKEGISLSKMVTLQMKKIEEMTLYILELEARMKKVENKQ